MGISTMRRTAVLGITHFSQQWLSFKTSMQTNVYKPDRGMTSCRVKGFLGPFAEDKEHTGTGFLVWVRM